MRVTVLELDKPNANGRIYTTKAAEAIIAQAAAKAEKGQPLLGQVGYPSGNQFSTVNLDKVSHVIEDLRIEDGLLVGTMRILETPAGAAARALVNGAVPVGLAGFRPRGFATVADDGTVSDYKLISIDLVNNPA